MTGWLNKHFETCLFGQKMYVQILMSVNVSMYMFLQKVVYTLVAMLALCMQNKPAAYWCYTVVCFTGKSVDN